MSYEYRGMVVREMNSSDPHETEEVAWMLGGNHSAMKKLETRMQTRHIKVLVVDGSVVGFCMYDEDDELVSKTIWFIEHYWVNEEYRGSRASTFFAGVLFNEYMTDMPVYAGSIDASTFTGFMRKVSISGRGNRMVKFYRLTKEFRDRIHKVKEKFKWVHHIRSSKT